MTFEEARAAFPVLERYAYLNAGSVGPMARPTYEAIAEAERDELGPRGGHEAFDRIMELRERLRRVVAAQIGVDADHVSLTTSTSEASPCGVGRPGPWPGGRDRHDGRRTLRSTRPGP